VGLAGIAGSLGLPCDEHHIVKAPHSLTRLRLVGLVGLVELAGLEGLEGLARFVGLVLRLVGSE
jgi:hypothetical protein